jgi:flagellar hook-associated protein 2
MATVTTGVGLISGLNFREIVDQLIAVEGQAVSRLQSRENSFKAIQASIKTLSANLLTLTTSATQLGSAKTFETLRVINPDEQQLQVTATATATVANHQFKSVRLASAQQLISRGFVNADQQTLTAGQITISRGGGVASETALSTLNGGAGVRRGIVRITDRSGATADVDLTTAATVSDVLDAINSTIGVSVVASVNGNRIVIADASGQSATNLTVVDRAGGNTAADLGIAKSVAASTLSGNDVYGATGKFTLASLNDGNNVRLIYSLPDIRITLADTAETKLDVNLNGAFTLDDVVNRINSHVDNGGKLTAAISDGRLVLTDNTGGGGPNALSVSDLNGAFAVRTLGLNATASGAVLTGNRLVAGINSVLLRNLRGGQGIDQPGSISLIDRAGTSATIDLSQAESLDEVLAAVNGATSSGNVKLNLVATVNSTGNGITIRDTTATPAGNLVIADVGAGTLAAQLGIAVDSSQSSVNSGSLNRRYVNEATSLATYAPGGGDVRRGVIAIKDSTGQEATVNITSAVRTIGDVIQAIESATAGKVAVQLNDTGDGFVLIDQAGGSGQLQVREVGGSTAAGLRILGTGTPGGDGKSRISSRIATVIDVAATDTLNTLRDKINAAKAGLQVDVVDDGSALSPKRLLVSSGTTGAAGRFILDDGGLGLGLDVRSQGKDALLQVGADPASAFLLASSTNRFGAVAEGVDVDLLAVGDKTANVSVVRDPGKVVETIKNFANGYNDAVKKLKELTRFDVESNVRGVLQGTGIALRLSSTLGELITQDGSGSTAGGLSFKDMGLTLSGDGTLQFDTFGLSIKVAQNFDGISKFFLDAQNGFAAKLKSTIESYTDPLTGKLTNETNGLQDSVDNLERRIGTLNQILQTRRDRLLQQFINLESLLGSLQAQQTALGQIQKITAPSSSSKSS